MPAARTKQSDASGFPQHSNEAFEMKLQLARATDVLAELYELLREVCPNLAHTASPRKSRVRLAVVEKALKSQQATALGLAGKFRAHWNGHFLTLIGLFCGTAAKSFCSEL